MTGAVLAATWLGLVQGMKQSSEPSALTNASHSIGGGRGLNGSTNGWACLVSFTNGCQ